MTEFINTGDVPVVPYLGLPDDSELLKTIKNNQKNAIRKIEEDILSISHFTSDVAILTGVELVLQEAIYSATEAKMASLRRDATAVSSWLQSVQQHHLAYHQAKSGNFTLLKTYFEEAVKTNIALAPLLSDKNKSARLINLARRYREIASIIPSTGAPPDLR